MKCKACREAEMLEEKSIKYQILTERAKNTPVKDYHCTCGEEGK